MADSLGVFAGNGGAGIVTNVASELILSGGVPSSVWAGDGAFNLAYQVCCWDGQGTNAVQNHGPVRSSGVALHPTWWHGTSPPYNEFVCCDISGASLDHDGAGAWTDVTPDDPTLSITGTPSRGSIVTLTVSGPPGAGATLTLGRRLEIVPDPNTEIEELVEATSTIDLGTIPSSGQVSFVFGVPGLVGTGRFLHFPPGSFFAAQALVQLQGGEIRRTNSIPIVAR